MEKRRFAGVGDVRFAAAAYPLECEPCIFEKRRMMGGGMRNVLRVTLLGSAAEIGAVFTDGAPWFIEEENEAGETVRYDKSSFCLAGDLVDHRDGSVTIYMAEKTEEERMVSLLEAENAQLLFEHLTGGVY